MGGVAGVVGAPASKRLLLAGAPAALGSGGSLRGAILRQLVGQWTYACCFARSLLLLLKDIYFVLEKEKGEDSLLDLWAEVQAELLAMACVAPVLESHLHARVIAGELWRRRSTCGGHTRLAFDVEAYLIERNVDEAGYAAASLDEVKASLPVWYDFMEICSNPWAPSSESWRCLGLVVGLQMDP